MSDIRRADPAARRRAMQTIIVGALIGTLVLVAIERCRIPLGEWLLADPGTAPQRVKWVLLSLAALVSAPLLAVAVHFWRLGMKVIRAREFPPPGYHVIRDTPIITGTAAASRGRIIQLLGLGCGIGAMVLSLLLWRLASMLEGHGMHP